MKSGHVPHYLGECHEGLLGFQSKSLCLRPLTRSSNGLAARHNMGEETSCSLDQIPLDERAPSIGLALSSGGARGLAHVGVIQVLEEEGIPIAAIAGVSMGAYIGSLWAAGFSGRELEKLALEIQNRQALFSLLDPLFPPTKGLIRGAKIRNHLERSLRGICFEELNVPMWIIATDLDQMAPHVFSQGNVSQAVHASAAIPGVCAPVSVDGVRYIDGAAVNPLPVDILYERAHVDHVIAVSVVPTCEDIFMDRDASFGEAREEPPHSWWQRCLRWLQEWNPLSEGNIINTYRRTMLASQIQLVEKESRKAKILIHPIPSISSWHDFQNAPRYIKAGREAAQALVPKMRELLKAHEQKPLLRGQPPREWRS